MPGPNSLKARCDQILLITIVVLDKIWNVPICCLLIFVVVFNVVISFFLLHAFCWSELPVYGTDTKTNLIFMVIILSIFVCMI